MAAEKSWQEMVKQRTQVFGDLVQGEEETDGTGEVDELSKRMAMMTKSYRAIDVKIVTKDEKERIRKEEEEKEGEEEEGEIRLKMEEDGGRRFRPTRKTIKFSDSKDDEEEKDEGNVLVVKGGGNKGGAGGILKPKSSFKFQSFDDIMKDLDLDSDSDDLGLKDIDDDDEDDEGEEGNGEENVFVVG